jgi:hypothetical protein
MAIRRQNPMRNVMQIPMSDELYEKIVNEADRRDVSMAAFLRPIVA